MGLGPLVTDIIITFCLAAALLYRYGNLMRHHIIVTVAVFIAWFFSFLIIFVLPLDVSATVFRQCIQENTINGTIGTVAPNSTTNGTTNGTIPDIRTCEEPWSYVSENVFPDLWRIVYWTSQCLTWLILPIMQSYSRAGEFTWKGKIKSAVIDNTIYYGTYLFICGILLIYLALQPSISLDWQKLKAIASSASNTWGLFLLVILLGYALVEVPRNLWNASKRGHSLTYAYFRAATLSVNKSDAEDAVDDILESLKAVNAVVRPDNPLYESVQTILRKVPTERWERINRRPPPDDATQQVPSEKALIRLHKQVIKALQTAHRTECQWYMLVDKVLLLEDVAENQNSHDCRFKHSFPPQRPRLVQLFFTPTVEWYWRCILQSYCLKLCAICCACLSAMVVWSELTFFNKEPVLTLFAQFLNLARVNYDYFTIEILSSLTIAYLCFCAYSTVLKIRVLNHYYIAPHHQTDEFSLIFSGMMLCRLTPPMCLNFLGLIHMDSHILKSHSADNPGKKLVETYYTQVMGHMDVIAIISDGFNIYFPMLMIAFCLATYFSLGSRILSVLGIDQFIDEEIRTDLVMEGRDLITRERGKRKRMEESASRRRDYQERFASGMASRYRNRGNPDADNGQRDELSDSSARAGLLRAAEPMDYYVVPGTEELRTARAPREEPRSTAPAPGPLYQGDPGGRLAYPPRGLFDDV